MSAQRRCQCEHICHTTQLERGLVTPDPLGKYPHSLSPNGNPGHFYGIKFFERYLQTVHTPHGDFELCQDCAKDCAVQAAVDLKYNYDTGDDISDGLTDEEK